VTRSTVSAEDFVSSATTTLSYVEGSDASKTSSMSSSETGRIISTDHDSPIWLINGSPVSEEDILLVLLASLPSTYDNVVVALETKSSALTVDLVTSALLNEERRQSGDTDQPAADSALAAHAKGKTKQASANVTCHLCQKPGHFRRTMSHSTGYRRSSWEGKS